MKKLISLLSFGLIININHAQNCDNNLLSQSEKRKCKILTSMEETSSIAESYLLKTSLEICSKHNESKNNYKDCVERFITPKFSPFCIEGDCKRDPERNVNKNANIFINTFCKKSDTSKKCKGPEGINNKVEKIRQVLKAKEICRTDTKTFSSCVKYQLKDRSKKKYSMKLTKEEGIVSAIDSCNVHNILKMTKNENDCITNVANKSIHASTKNIKIVPHYYEKQKFNLEEIPSSCFNTAINLTKSINLGHVSMPEERSPFVIHKGRLTLVSQLNHFDGNGNPIDILNYETTSPYTYNSQSIYYNPSNEPSTLGGLEFGDEIRISDNTRGVANIGSYTDKKSQIIRSSENYDEMDKLIETTCSKENLDKDPEHVNSCINAISKISPLCKSENVCIQQMLYAQGGAEVDSHGNINFFACDSYKMTMVSKACTEAKKIYMKKDKSVTLRKADENDFQIDRFIAATLDLSISWPDLVKKNELKECLNKLEKASEENNEYLDRVRIRTGIKKPHKFHKFIRGESING